MSRGNLINSHETFTSNIQNKYFNRNEEKAKLYFLRQSFPNKQAFLRSFTLPHVFLSGSRKKKKFKWLLNPPH